jgi:formamidopyrimidine-DNA glycosylase
MPELAEVEFYRKQWNPGVGATILSVHANFHSRIFRGIPPAAFHAGLTGSTFLGSEAHGKQMLFRFSGGKWMGIHLGMSGTLRTGPPDSTPKQQDLLILYQKKRSLILNDYRHFGRVLWHEGPRAPEWWATLPPSLLSPDFTLKALTDFLQRRARTSLKGVLLMQERFPGIGNWMADEILWRTGLDPRRPAGSLEIAENKRLFRAIRSVCRQALKVISTDFSDPPSSWLFPHRWKKGGSCPRCATSLHHATIAGRTTCWCPSCQPSMPPFGPARKAKTLPLLKKSSLVQTAFKKRWLRLSKNGHRTVLPKL